MYSVFVALDTLLQKEIKAVSVFICEEDVLLRIPSNNDMEIGARVVKSMFACHTERVPGECNIASLTPRVALYACADDYSIGDKDEDKWLSKGVGEIRSILGYPGDILPTRKMHLVILVGFEVDRAKEIIFSYEPHTLSLGYGQADDPENAKHSMINFKAYQKILPIFENVDTFNFPYNDPVKTKYLLEQQIAKYPNHNTVIAAMNSKISTVGVSLAALDNHRIQLCYATTNQYNFKNYSKPGDSCYVFEIEGFCK